MRVFFLFALCFALLTLLIGGVLFFRFDPEPFRPSLERILTRSFQVPVRIGKVSVEKKFPPRLFFNDFRFAEAGGRDSWLQSDRSTAGIDFRGLFHWPPGFALRELLLEEPVLRVKRGRDGIWNFKAAASSLRNVPEISGNEPAPVLPAGLTFLPPVLTFKHGKLEYRDESASPLFTFNLGFEGTAQSASEGVKLLFKADLPGSTDSASFQMLLEADYDAERQSTLFELKQAAGLWNLQGEARLSVTGDSQFKVTLETRGLDLAKMFPADSRAPESITGLITTRLEGYGEGSHPDLIKRTLVMDGAIDIRDGVFHRLNFLKETLSGLSPMPAFSEILKAKLPGPAGELFRGEDLPFEMLRADVHAAQGNVTFQEVLVSQEASYIMEGEGNWAILEHHVDFSGKLVLLEEFSRSLTLQAKEFIPLRNSKGRIMIPFKYRGVLPGASLYPDLNYVAAQFFQRGGQQLMEENQQVLSKNWESRKT